ncbi:sensor domain-containing phosphodiesterase [Aurantiacibacter gilvus]|uniref:EAL domain-containing protein n=1 Tax=Aurantiacibacter gilvus TaxID=3139141 RepID=A0ABU9IGH1_9SPHN
MRRSFNLNRDFEETRVQASLDRMIKHCADEFGSEIALVSLVDEVTQTFIATHGTELKGTPREFSFCRFVVESEEGMLVNDARQDERFAKNPLVLGAPHIRSYAGSPITNSAGKVIGALCLIDKAPCKFPPETLEVLGRYASGVNDMIRLHETSLQSRRMAEELQVKNDNLRSANRVFRQAERIARIGSWEVEIDSGKLFWSEGVYRIHGLEPGRDITLEEAVSFYDESDQLTVAAFVQSAIKERGSFEFEAVLSLPNGEAKPVHSSGEYLENDGERPARLVGVIRDISSQYEARSALEHAANHDSLTGLPNRHAFDRMLQSRLRKHNQKGQEVILIILDLDGFKDINDTFGHIAGDIVLEEATIRMRSVALEGVMLARWGGDEFVAVLPEGTSVQGAIDYAHAMIETIGTDTDIGGRSVSLGASCGIARSRREVGARELIRRADTALYHGKKSNPGGVTVYSSEFEAENRHRQFAISEVKAAIRNDRLFAGYQPIVDLETGEYLGFEALLRLHSRTNQRLAATEVLPALLDPAISRQVSRKMTEFVAAEVTTLFEHFPDLRFVSLNATESDLLDPHFVERFLASFRSHGVDLGRIVLEVTETMLLVNDPSAVRKVLRELSSAGIKVALDDFGTGFSSLSHLRDFPIDKVKIDQSFVQGMVSEQDSRILVQAIIGMARSLGKKVIAEGVETQAQRSLLLQMGCSVAQGFLFSPALDVGQIILRSQHNCSKRHGKARAA